MSVIGDGEQQVIADGDPAIQADRGIADEPLGARPGILPDLASCLGIQREDLVHARDVHDPVDYDGCAFDHALIGNREEPLRGQVGDVPQVDLVQLAMAVASVASVICRPIEIRTVDGFAIGSAFAAQQAQ